MKTKNKNGYEKIIKDIENICDLYNVFIYICSGISAVYYFFITLSISVLFLIGVATALALLPSYLLNKLILIFKEYSDQKAACLDSISEKLENLLQYEKERSIFNK